jgi:hypothetical protein
MVKMRLSDVILPIILLLRGINNGQKKKEPANVHRQRIADAAQALFLNKGIEMTTMDDVAKKAVYGKATLYVYFKTRKRWSLIRHLRVWKRFMT